MTNPREKPIEWLASAKKDLSEFPEDVRRSVGYGLGFVQLGLTPSNAKPLHGLGSGVWELVEDHDGNAYRGVYVVRFENVIYVLHCFQKKSKKGRETPRPDLEVIRRRLADAQADYQQRFRDEKR
jgi:phage-related protein